MPVVTEIVVTMYVKLFQLFQDIVPNIPIGDCASGHRDENRNKSRDIMLLPRKSVFNPFSKKESILIFK